MSVERKSTNVLFVVRFIRWSLQFRECVLLHERRCLHVIIVEFILHIDNVDNNTISHVRENVER